MDQPKLIDNFLPDQIYRDLRDLVRGSPLSYGAKSNHETDPWGHLSWKPIPFDGAENLADCRNFTEFKLVEPAWEETNRRWLDERKMMVPVRCYANTYTYGMDGYMHTDSHREGDLTIIIYICDKWMYDWAGETVVLSRDKKTYWSFVPVANRAVILPSNLFHAARAVSRMCPEARTTFMFKVRPYRVGMFEALSKWLVQNNALLNKHQQGTLHDHLVRVYQLLHDKEAPLRVSLAGGLHSIYGTNIYKQQTIRKDDAGRKLVRDNWGPDVEDLVYRFSELTNRPSGLEKIAEQPSGQIEHDLCMIEAANLLDQGSLDNCPYLKYFWDSYSV